LVGRTVHDSNPIIRFKDASFREADYEPSRWRGGRFACRDEGGPDTAALGVLKDNPTRARMEQS
jgi:hypothetical protein